jgi:hypothetical protein
VSFITNGLAGAAQGLLMTGNPVGAVVGGLAGAVTGGSTSTSSLLGGAANTALSAGENAYMAANVQLDLQQMGFQYQQQVQADSFDNMTSEKSELMRESNELRNVAMEQRKADNEITKEFIKSIA